MKCSFGKCAGWMPASLSKADFDTSVFEIFRAAISK